MLLGGILRLGVTTKLKFEGMANQVNQVNGVFWLPICRVDSETTMIRYVDCCGKLR
jgi:hypothetical protein